MVVTFFFHNKFRLDSSWLTGGDRAQTAWGSREGADTNDAYRMIHLTQTDRDQAAEIRALVSGTQ